MVSVAEPAGVPGSLLLDPPQPVIAMEAKPSSATNASIMPGSLRRRGRIQKTRPASAKPPAEVRQSAACVVPFLPVVLTTTVRCPSGCH